MPVKRDPILLEVYRHRFAAVAEEMGVALMRTAFSPNIKERRDFSCALFDASGFLVAQAEHIPVHLGAMPLSVRAVLDATDFAPGDMVMVNDPFRGGTHLPDITLVAPVFAGMDRPVFFTANRAHHSDVGGMAAGSMPLSTSIFQEGVVVPPVKIVREGRIDRGIMDFFLANVRTPVEREGDFAAQIMANLTGARRIEALAASCGLAVVASQARGLMDHAEALVRAAVKSLPDGTWEAEDVLDDDGAGTRDIALRLRVTIRGDEALFDFAGSSPQVPGCVNATRAIAVSAVLYAARCLIAPGTPANAGFSRPLAVSTAPGTVVDARFPAAVAGGNVETSQRLVDVIFSALGKVLPGRVPAASQGTMNNVAVGGLDPRTNQPFAYYETLAGGMGAGASGPGESAVHSHMTNTLNTPVEALEYAYPLLVREYGLRRGSGGKGRFPGGDGLCRELEFLSPAEVTVLSERRAHQPYGLDGGGPGAVGRNALVRNGEAMPLPGKCHFRVEPGDRLRVETPGGGGYGTI
ncbi:MAG: hydantoinase B/oxoprolinase family protein [Thermodesulfobacteriota bacterium]